MKIKRFTGGNLDNNGYVIYQKSGGSCYIIDPGFNPDRFLKFIKEEKLSLKGILLTHHHYDHTGGVQKIKDHTDCPVYIHREDMYICSIEADFAMEDGDVFYLDGEEIKVLHTPGHTMGGVCFFSEKSKCAFTGDTIFDTDLGRTDLKDGDYRLMEKSCREVINKWGNDIEIYPGHEGSSNMKFVRKLNLEFLEAIKERG